MYNTAYGLQIKILDEIVIHRAEKCMTYRKSNNYLFSVYISFVIILEFKLNLFQ